MQAFDYEAVSKSGKTRRGTLMAVSARAARRDLIAQNLTPLKMIEASRVISNRKANAKQKPSQHVKVKRKHLTEATRQLAILIQAETPVTEALKITALQFENSAIRSSLLDVRTQILEGRRMSEAMRATGPKIYSDLYRSMVSAGENTGQLGLVLERLAVDMESAQKVRRKVLGATIYPMVLSVVALAVIVILMVFVVPKVVNQFASFNQELPALTKMTIAFSHWLKLYGIGALAVIGLGIFGAGQALKVKSIRRRFDKFILGLPFFGQLNRDMNAARFARTMSGLLDSGVPVVQAINTAANTLNNVILKQAALQVVEQVKGGASVGAALKKTSVFPPLMVHMIASGETSGDLGKMFAVSADYLEGEFESATTIVLSLLEPLIIVVLGGVVLLIVAAIFLPILRLNTLAY